MRPPPQEAKRSIFWAILSQAAAAVGMAVAVLADAVVQKAAEHLRDAMWSATNVTIMVT